MRNPFHFKWNNKISFSKDEEYVFVCVGEGGGDIVFVYKIIFWSSLFIQSN